MFDQITSNAGGRARGLSSVLVSVVAHGGIISAGLGLSYCKAHTPRSEGSVAVSFRPAPPPPPPPPPAGHRAHAFHETPKRPIAPKVAPTTLVQPRRLPRPEQQAPAPEAEDDDGAGGDGPGLEGGVAGGAAGGLVGGTVGGVAGGVTGGTVGGMPGGTGEEAPVLFGAGMTQPRPTADCRPGKPPTPEQALQMGITGTVLVAWTVHADGRVGNIILKNEAGSPILFEAVKKWLAGCPFTPGMVGDRPAPITLVRPFIFTQK